MVDSKGYLKLIDVGIAKTFSSKSERTFTIVGTPYCNIIINIFKIWHLKLFVVRGTII